LTSFGATAVFAKPRRDKLTGFVPGSSIFGGGDRSRSIEA
jgi:hypothetical protein